MATTGGPNIKTDGLVLALDSYSNIRGFTKFGTSGTNNSHRAIRNLVDKSTTYSLSDTNQLTGGNYFTLYALTYPESGQTPASRNGITAGFNNTSATKLYSHSRDLGYYVFDESTNTWVADSYFNGERISGHVYDTYDGEPDQHQKFQDDYDVIKQFFPNATHIVIGSHASENIDNDADTVTRLKEIGLPDDAVGLGRVECILAGKVNKPHTHHYVRENVSSAVAHMNLRLPLEGVGGATTFIDSKIINNNQTEYPFLTEKFSGNYQLNYTLYNPKITIDISGTVIGPMKLPLLGELDTRAPYSPIINIVNLQATYAIKTIEVYAGIKNILDFKPASNSIARAFDPFDSGVEFGANGQVIATPNNPNALSFDPSYVYYSNQGINGFLGIRYHIK